MSDQGRSIDIIRPEKSSPLMDAISKALDPELWETFKINLGHKIAREYSINTSFSCKWTKIEEAIQESLGQAPNIERLIKCMEKENWEGLTLQQALQDINNYHNNNLKTQKLVYESTNGEIKEYKKNRDSAKIYSATKLARKLPSEFDPIQFELQKNLANAYYDTHESFEDIIEKLEKIIKERGLSTLYSTTKIKIKPVGPKPIPPDKQMNEKVGRNLILQYLKSNKDLTGEITDDETLGCIIQQADLCKQCLRRSCKRNQIYNKKTKHCTKTLHIINYDKLIADLEPENKPAEVFTNKTTKNIENKINHQKNEPENADTNIKPEERFVDITDDSPTDMEAFMRSVKELGIPTLAEKEKRSIYSAQLIKRNCTVEPEPHPYQEFIDKKNQNKTENIPATKLDTETKTPNNKTKERKKQQFHDKKNPANDVRTINMEGWATKKNKVQPLNPNPDNPENQIQEGKNMDNPVNPEDQIEERERKHTRSISKTKTEKKI